MPAAMRFAARAACVLLCSSWAGGAHGGSAMGHSSSGGRVSASAVLHVTVIVPPVATVRLGRFGAQTLSNVRGNPVHVNCELSQPRPGTLVMVSGVPCRQPATGAGSDQASGVVTLSLP